MLFLRKLSDAAVVDSQRRDKDSSSVILLILVIHTVLQHTGEMFLVCHVSLFFTADDAKMGLASYEDTSHVCSSELTVIGLKFAYRIIKYGRSLV